MKKILYPPIWLLMLLSVFSAGGLVVIFTREWMNTPVAYMIYTISFYTLVVVGLFFVRVFPKQYKRIKKQVQDTTFGDRYFTDASFRTQLSLYGSLGMNLLYIGINLASYMLYQSMWFICLAVYYIILSVMRFFLANYGRKNGFGKKQKSEWRRALSCSYILLTINFALTGAVLMILYQDKGYQYHGIMIYVIALYTFYITTNAIINLVKTRKYNSPVMTMAGIVTLSAALVSMLSLETAMFSQFGQQMSGEDKWLMIALTGAGVSIIIVVMAIYMIVKCTKEIRNSRGNKYGKKRKRNI